MIADVALLTLLLSAIIALRYLATAALVHSVLWGRAGDVLWGPAARRLNQRPASARDLRREIRLSLISSPIYAFPAAVAYAAFRRGGTALYADPLGHGLAWIPISIAIYLLAQDAYYYWLHRLLHHPRLFRWAHRGHHLSREPTAFASFAFDPAEAVFTAWLLPALTFVVPLQLGVAVGLLMFMTIVAVLNHCGVEIWSDGVLRSLIGRQLITATHHDQHHRRYTANYGLYFRFWDRLMGTEAQERA